MAAETARVGEAIASLGLDKSGTPLVRSRVLLAKQPRITKAPEGQIIRMKSIVLDQLRDGKTYVAAAKKAQIDLEMIIRWQEQDAQFRIACELAERVRRKVVADSLYEKAANGHVLAQIFWLCNRARSEWQHVQKVEIEKNTQTTKVLRLVWDGRGHDGAEAKKLIGNIAASGRLLERPRPELPDITLEGLSGNGGNGFE